jgi:glycerol-3-phosphate dehydrogenase
VWRYAGVRPLYDDGSGDPSSITRDYTLCLDQPKSMSDNAPVLSIFGGKLTTYRRLAEHAVNQINAALGKRRPEWTRHSILPGGELPAGGLAELSNTIAVRYPWLVQTVREPLLHRHGSDLPALLDDSQQMNDLGEDFGGGLYERELAWLLRHEWALSADDVLWRRTKCGLHMNEAQRQRVVQRLG